MCTLGGSAKGMYPPGTRWGNKPEPEGLMVLPAHTGWEADRPGHLRPIAYIPHIAAGPEWVGREARKTSAMDKGIRENYLRIGGRAGTGAALKRGLKGMGWVGRLCSSGVLGQRPLGARRKWWRELWGHGTAWSRTKIISSFWPLLGSRKEQTSRFLTAQCD